MKDVQVVQHRQSTHLVGKISTYQPFTLSSCYPSLVCECEAHSQRHFGPGAKRLRYLQPTLYSHEFRIITTSCSSSLDTDSIIPRLIKNSYVSLSGRLFTQCITLCLNELLVDMPRYSRLRPNSIIKSEILSMFSLNDAFVRLQSPQRHSQMPGLRQAIHRHC